MNALWSFNAVWFVLIGVLFAGYAIADGFDLGVGAWHLTVHKDEERRLLLNAIGPVWDGNEVWLLTAGGALFAAFPEAYATSFSGFYPAMMLVLCALIFRAVAIEFRSKLPQVWWRRAWDISFSIGSILSAFLMGVAMGNLVRGVPLSADHEFAGTFLGLLNPYALLVGVTTVALFMMHGAIYLVLKTEGELHNLFRRKARAGMIFFIIFYAITTMATLILFPRMTEHMWVHPVLFGVVLLNLLAIASIPREFHHGRDFRAFLFSSSSIALLLALFGLGIFPRLIISSPNPENSLTIFNAASSHKTLGIMLIIAGLGVPLVLAYTAVIHWVFRGKVHLDSSSY